MRPNEQTLRLAVQLLTPGFPLFIPNLYLLIQQDLVVEPSCLTGCLDGGEGPVGRLLWPTRTVVAD